MQRRAVGLLDIATAAGAMQLAPGATVGVTIGTDIAEPDPAPIGAGVLWDFPECKIAVISMSYVHMYLSENVEKSVKQCVRPLRFPSTSLR